MEIKHRQTNDVLHTVEADTLRNANLSGVTLSGANLMGADLRGANLRDTDLYGANLHGVDFSGADLRGAIFRKANLYGAKLHDTDLYGVDFSGANLIGADLQGAKLSGEVLKKPPISILNLRWDVLITTEYLTIGCHRHTHEVWEAFTDDEIAKMESRASEFWKVNKEWLLGACKAHRSE